MGSRTEGAEAEYENIGKHEAQRAHLMAALAEDGLLDAALEGIIGGHVEHMEAAPVVDVARAHQQVVHKGGGLHADVLVHKERVLPLTRKVFRLMRDSDR